MMMRLLRCFCVLLLSACGTSPLNTPQPVSNTPTNASPPAVAEAVSAPAAQSASAPPATITSSAPLAASTPSATPGSLGFIDRQAIRLFAADMAARHGFDAAVVEAALSQVEYQGRAVELLRPQPESTAPRSWQSYRSRFVEPVRLRAGMNFWAQHQATVARAEASYGVPAEIIVAIIGVETIYGRNVGSFNTLATLSTLAFDYPPRAELFRRELEALFLLAREQNRPITSFRGSFAGALGLPQFLPSSVRAYAVDFDGDGRIDLENSPVDAIGSVANFLASHGWQRGTPIVAPARLLDGSNPVPLLAGAPLPTHELPTLQAAGVKSEVPTEAAALRAALIDLATPGQLTEYWLGFQNFYVITRYNRSNFYAMAVHDFAQALKKR